MAGLPASVRDRTAEPCASASTPSQHLPAPRRALLVGGTLGCCARTTRTHTTKKTPPVLLLLLLLLSLGCCSLGHRSGPLHWLDWRHPPAGSAAVPLPVQYQRQYSQPDIPAHRTAVLPVGWSSSSRCSSRCGQRPSSSRKGSHSSRRCPGRSSGSSSSRPRERRQQQQQQQYGGAAVAAADDAGLSGQGSVLLLGPRVLQDTHCLRKHG